MTLVKCLECGSEQDFEAVVGYCDNCGKKLPVPHTRGQTAARKKFLADQRSSEVGATNIAVTAAAFLAGAAALVAMVVVVAMSAF